MNKMELLKEELRPHKDNEKGLEKSKVEKDAVSEDRKSPQKIGNPKPGAPKKKKYERMKSEIEGRRQNKCGHYGMLGHNQQTCQLLSPVNKERFCTNKIRFHHLIINLY